MNEQTQPKVKFEQACFKCGSHYCLMDCFKDKESATERSWVGLTNEDKRDIAVEECGMAGLHCSVWEMAFRVAEKVEIELKQNNT